MKLAFIGMGQGYPSHVWMRRMRAMLGERVVVSIDDRRNTKRRPADQPSLRLVPRKMNRVKRLAAKWGWTNATHQSERCDWMLRTIEQASANCVLVNFLDYASEFAEVWRKLDIPVVVHCHGYDITWDLCDCKTGETYHDPGYPARIQNLPDNVWFIANSQYTRGQLHKLGLNDEKISVKRFGVPLSDAPQPMDATQNSVLFLGRLVDFKGPVETVRAFDHLAGSHPQAVLDLAGSGPLDHQVDQAIASAKHASRIHRHGTVDLEQGKLLRRRAAVFTAHNQLGPTSRQIEAFGVSLLEAMGCGIPVVTGRSGGITDFVTSGENGYLFEPGDENAHAEMLAELLASPEKRRRFGTAAWETVRDRFQPSHEKQDLLRILDQARQQGTRPTQLLRNAA